jgi:hypothetical protein
LCFPLCGWPPSLWSKANLGNAGDRLTQWLNHSPIVWLEHVQTQAPGFPCHLDKLQAAQFFEVLRMRSNESKYKMDSIWFYNIYICIFIYMCVHMYVYIRMYTPFLIWKLDHSALSCPLSCLWLVQAQLDTGSVLLNITGPHWLLSIFPVILSEKVQLDAVGPKHKSVQCPPTSRDGCVVMLQSQRSINPSFLFSKCFILKDSRDR